MGMLYACARVCMGMHHSKLPCIPCCRTAVAPQELGDKAQRVARLTEEIAAADATHAALKAKRNAAQDVRKEAWRTQDELAVSLSSAEAEFAKAFEVGARLCAPSPGLVPYIKPEPKALALTSTRHL
jgi:hypothetical protein